MGTWHVAANIAVKTDQSTLLDKTPMTTKPSTADIKPWAADLLSGKLGALSAPANGGRGRFIRLVNDSCVARRKYSGVANGGHERDITSESAF
jgi:hypothetical protein